MLWPSSTEGLISRTPANLWPITNTGVIMAIIALYTKLC